MAPYNATLTGIRKIHEELAVFRVELDDGPPAYEPGQFSTLGLMDQERGVGECHRVDKPEFLHRRAYSISHPVWENGKLAENPGYLEFYVVLVREGARGKLPALTPRLFALEPGARLSVGKITGHYVLSESELAEKRDLVFCATGTGEAPHCAMIWKLLSSGYEGTLTSLICVRHRRDLGYLQVFEEVARNHANFRYHVLMTREPGIPKQYIQDFITSGALETSLGAKLDPARHSFYLCGNPSMIGIPKRSPDGKWSFPEGPPGVVQILMEKGFVPDIPKTPGNIHYEKYW